MTLQSMMEIRCPECDGEGCLNCQATGAIQVPRCQAYRMVKMPYDSLPEVAQVQCKYPEDHTEEHEDDDAFDWRMEQ